MASIKDRLLHLFSLPKYGDNLHNGQSLLEQLRAATAAELEQPSEALNSQVVDTINKEIITGKNCWDVVDLLKKRLHSSKAHKQWLAVQLVATVLHKCSGVLAVHQEELLMAIARVATRPRSADRPEGRRTRATCMDVLGSFGEAGTHAFATITRLDGAWAPRGGAEHVAHSSLSVPEASTLPRPGSHLSLLEQRRLADALRAATDKDLPEPCEELVADVIGMLHAEVKAGKDAREIADLLRQRLHSHKPHKQWLAVQLLGRVLRDPGCEAALAAQQGELLEEVARTMMRPAKLNSEEGKHTREAALALLHEFGPAGEAAILAVNRQDGLWGSGETAHVDTHSSMAVPETNHIHHLSASEARALAGLLHAATDEQLTEPSEDVTAQVLQTIKDDITHGKDSRDVVDLLRQRLHSRKPHKQWLAVQLVGRVVRECHDVLADHEVELLEEVARVMGRPAGAATPEGARTRQAAVRLLRARGAAGTAALLAANRLDGLWGSAEVLHVDTHSSMAVPEKPQELSAEARICAEVGSLVAQADAAAQLLHELLGAAGERLSGGAGPSSAGPSSGRPSSTGADEAFEQELARGLVARVSALRGQLADYQPQVAALPEPEGGELRGRLEAALALLDGAAAHEQALGH